LTRLELMKEIVGTLTEAGIGEAKSDALILMDYIAGISRNELMIHGDETVPEDTVKSIRDAALVRTQHVPVQQITGFQSFMGLEFAVDEHVLIPRQDTEILVEEVLKLGFSGMDILDMCTGSGCILLSLLKYMHDCRGTGVDISEDALKVAMKNSSDLEIPARFLQGDLFGALDDEDRYDIIVSNPPYIKSDVIPTLMEEVKDHEPMLALDGEADGLAFYRRIVDGAGKHLRRAGMLFFEIGYDQGESVSELMKDAGFTDVEVYKDLAGLDRVVSGTYQG